MYTKVANINIEGEGKVFHYITEYHPQITKTTDTIEFIGDNYKVKSLQSDDIIFLNKNSSNYIKNFNLWNELNISGGKNTVQYIKKEHSISKISLYFPLHSVDTYENGVKYGITLNTWINGKKIILGSYIISRHDLNACDRPKRFMGLEYYECMDFNIIDPYDLTYSDDWEDWRRIYCGELQDDNNIGVNTVGSILCINIHPIIENEYGEYIKSSKFVGGQNSINIVTNYNDYMNLDLSSNINDKNIDEPMFNCKLSFNEVYNNNLAEYLKETYWIDSCRLKFGLVIGNDSDIYGVYNSNLIELNESNPTQISHSFRKKVILSNGNFNNWDGYKEGIYVVASVDILNDEEDSVISLISNKLPLTPKLYSYFINDEFVQASGYKTHIYNSINIDKVKMDLYNINTVNKIVNNVIYTQKNDDVKHNIIQPVFFRVTDIDDILIHPEVTENICINLDRYKSKVDNFILKIEGIVFHEIGRNGSGCIFKIPGKQLPKKLNSGIYYILNQDEELITTGKYTYAI